MKKFYCIVIVIICILTKNDDLFKFEEFNNDSIISPPMMVSVFNPINSKSAIINTESINEENEFSQLKGNIPVIKINEDKLLEDKMNLLIKKDIDKFTNNIKSIAERDGKINKANGYDVIKYIANVDYKVTKNNNNILSLIIDLFSYTGGAHGNYTKKSYNFDLNTGNNGVIGDFVGEDDNYREKILKGIKEEINKNPNMYFKEVVEYLNGIPYDKEFFLTDKGVVVYFQQYEIAPYVAGIAEFIVPYDAFEKGLKSNVDIKESSITVEEVIHEKEESLINKKMYYPEINNMSNKALQNKINKYLVDEILKFENKAKENPSIKYIGTNFTSYFQQPKLLSIVISYFASDEEGNNIFFYDKGYTFNLDNGTLYELPQLFKTGIDYISIINNYVKEEIKNMEKSIGKKGVYNFDTIKTSTAFYLRDGNLIISFLPGEIAPKEYYKQLIKIPLKNLTPYIKENIV